MTRSICNIHVATSRFLIQRLLAWHISTCDSYSSRGCQGLPRHTIMWNSLGSTWNSRSDSGEHWKGVPHSWEHWKGAPPFVSRQCFPNKRVDAETTPAEKHQDSGDLLPLRTQTSSLHSSLIDTLVSLVTPPPPPPPPLMPETPPY